MGAIASTDALITLATATSGAPEQRSFFKSDRAAGTLLAALVAQQWTSLWQADGCLWNAGTAPGAAAAPTSATAGALPITDATGGRQKRLLNGIVNSNLAGSLLLYDRLLHNSGLSGTNTGAQSVGSAITRSTGAASVGSEIWIEINQQIGASSTTATVSYTNQAGNAAISQTVRLGNTNFREAQRIMKVPLALGDTGVRGVTSVTLAATTGTAGDFGIIIARPVAIFGVNTAGVAVYRDFVATTPKPRLIQPAACLAAAWFPVAAAAAPPQWYGRFTFGEF